MKIEEFDRETSWIWHWAFTLSYAFALLHIIACWWYRTSPELIAVLIVIESMGYQVFRMARKMWRNEI